MSAGLGYSNDQLKFLDPVEAAALNSGSDTPEEPSDPRDTPYLEEYERIERVDFDAQGTTVVAQANAERTRSPKLPHDNGLVCLGNEGRYINATRLSFADTPETLVLATQAPMCPEYYGTDTIADFWELVLQEQVSTVVSLARVAEGRNGCPFYWPDRVGSSLELTPSLQVTLMGEDPPESNTISREFSVKGLAKGHSREQTVRHLQYGGWPDYGVPDEPHEILQLVRCAQKAQLDCADAGPLLVHCSAGHGRTGCFITIYTRVVGGVGPESIYDTVSALRRARNSWMVQGAKQYVFCHHAIAVAADGSPPRAPSRAPTASVARHSVTGLSPGPYPVGVCSYQFDDHSRTEVGGGARCLLTEVWYPATDDTFGKQPNNFSDFLRGPNSVARGPVDAEVVNRANDHDAIGGYREGITIAELDQAWPNIAVRDAVVRESSSWPVVLFSHGNGAFRASYVYFTEFLASHGFVVAACDHPGSSRFTVLNGKAVKGAARDSERANAEQEQRPLDMIFILDSLDMLNKEAGSMFENKLDVSSCAVTGMSFGGWTTAKVLDMGDRRVKAGIMQCPSIHRGGFEREGLETPAMLMLGLNDTVMGADNLEIARKYLDKATSAKALLEIKRAGHCTFTSCELYDPEYGNGIGRSKQLTQPGDGAEDEEPLYYDPLPITDAHAVINDHALAFLDVYVRDQPQRKEYFMQVHYDRSEVTASFCDGISAQ